MNGRPDRRAIAVGGLGFAATAALWIYLLAGQKVFTAAMAAATPLLDWLRAVWVQSEDMGHGPILPLVSLFALWRRRPAIRAAIGAPDGRGVLLTAVGLVLFWAGLLMEDVRVCLLALVLWTWTVPFALWGWGVARQLVFPCGYLLLSIPIDTLVIYLTMKLRLLAAALAVGIVNGLGLETLRVGTGIHSMAGGGINLDVAEPCSGLRSIFAMTALAGAYAFFTQRSLWKQWLLFAFAIPVAVAGNVVRIVAIILVAAWRGEEAALGFYHDYSGYLVFLVGILLLVEIGRGIAALGRQGGTGPERKGNIQDTETKKEFELKPRISTRAIMAHLAAAVGVPALLAIGVWVARHQPPVEGGGLGFLAGEMPESLMGWTASRLFHCHNERCLFSAEDEEFRRRGLVPSRLPTPANGEGWPTLSEMKPVGRCPECQEGDLYEVSLGERRTLPGDTRIRRLRYRSEWGQPGLITVTVVASGTGRHSIHRPELCIPAQGFVMSSIRDGQLPQTGIPVKLVSLERTVAGQGRVWMLGFAYYFFDGQRATASHAVRLFWTAWDRVIHRHASRWVMVTAVSEPGFDDPRAEARLLSLLDQFHPRLFPPSESVQ